ncbi:hypothetical protein XCM_19520 [Xanthomonas citri pv. mangiferaeindicae]|nr:hypothetical protein XCM_19520 [Xanthomonas citri pv. mangiferaeindicae]
MRIFSELLFQHGHIADVALAQRLAEPDTAVEAIGTPQGNRLDLPCGHSQTCRR